MASTTFVAHNTKVAADWLNEVDAVIWDVFNGATTAASARTAIGVYSSAEVDTLLAAQNDASEINFTPYGGLIATDVQAAIQELDDEKLRVDGTVAMTGELDAGGGVWLHDDDVFSLGTAKAFQFKYSAGNGYVTNYDGHYYFRNFSNGKTIELKTRDTDSTDRVAATFGGAYQSVQLNYLGSTVLSTSSTGVDVTGNIAVTGTVDGRDVATDGATLDAIPTTYVAVAGDTMTGDLTVPNLVTPGLVDGRDISADGATLDGVPTTYLKLTGGTLTGPLTLSSLYPQLKLYETDGGVDSKNWSFLVDGNTFTLRLYDDAQTAYNSAFSLGRSGNTPTNFNVLTTGFQHNGNSVWTAANLTPSDYLPLAGGTVTGDLTVNGNTQVGAGTPSNVRQLVVLDNAIIPALFESSSATGTAVDVRNVGAGTPYLGIRFNDNGTQKGMVGYNNPTDSIFLGGSQSTQHLSIDRTTGNATFVGNIAVGGTVDGRDVATDGSKLDGIEAGATADQTGAEIKTAYEAEANTNAYTDAEKTKLAGIETGATADQTAAEIKTAYESNLDTNAFTDAEQTKLAGIAAGAEVNTVDSVNTQTGAVVLDADDIDDTLTTNKFTTATDISKLAGIEAGATADQTASEILTLIKTVDGTGSGLDSDLLDGYERSSARSTNTVVSRDSSGNIYVDDVFADRGDGTGVIYFGGVTRYLWYDGTKYVLASAGLEINGGTAWHSGNDGSGSGLDADTLDTYEATAFPRKAEAATITNSWTMQAINMQDYELTRPKFKDYAVTHTTPTISAGAITFDCANGNSFNVSLTANITSITLSNPPATGSYGEIVIEFKQDATGSRTVTGWPASVKWPGGTAPTITTTATTGTDYITLRTHDGGTTWYGDYSQDYS